MRHPRLRCASPLRADLGTTAALALVLAAGCSTAPELAIAPTNRVVLAELFTWQRCTYCPYAAHTLESLASEFCDSVVVVAYHRRVAGDTLSPAYVEARRRLYYDAGGEPATVFDGGPVVRTQGPEYNYETFRSYILAARSVTPKAQLEVVAWLDSAAGTVEVRAWGVDSTPEDTLRLFVVVTEDSVRATQTGATDSVFNGVMRAMLPDTPGRAARLSRADTVKFVELFELSGSWHSERLSATVFVQDMTTGSVLQAARCRRFETERR
jgi:thiol-disulfide isomerase/thioredoxin